jgi:glutamate-5-semialdehyde dehydrogenase
LTEVISDAASATGLPENAVQSIADTSREAVLALMKMNDYVDVLIPRGGADLIQTVIQNSTVPVIETGVGNCHVYIDKAADLRMALAILINAKCQRPGVCNAAETMLVHEEIARKFLPKALEELQAAGVTIFGCPVSLSIYPGIEIATEQDWRTEYLDLKIACKVVTGLEEAIDHINQFGSKHSEAIVTEDYSAARRFLDEVDAAAVYVNASTRFTDGGQFGLGAEIGISTQKLHARGPMALEALTSTKWVVYGNGQIRE